MTPWETIEAGLAAYGAMSVVATIFWAGRSSAKIRTAPKLAKHERRHVVQLYSREEISKALGAEINKGKRANPDEVERLGQLLKKVS